MRNWLHRFNEAGLPGLFDEDRTGRPPTYGPEEVSVVVATALTKPDDLGLPFGHWTLDRLEVYLNEEKGIAIKRSRITVYYYQLCTTLIRILRYGCRRINH